MLGESDPFEASRWLETPAEPVLLRPIREGDEEELLRFFRDRLSVRSRYLFPPHDTSRPEQCLAEFTERIRLHQERGRLAYVVEQDGAIVGYFYLTRLHRTDGVLPLVGMGLTDALHGMGIGGAMLDHLLDAARVLGLPAVELSHEVTNERGARVYLSRGFVYTGEEERSGDGGRVERVMRWRG